MAGDTVWTDARRRIVSKTLFDILKIEVGAAYASKFFAEFAIPVKIALIAVMIGTAGVAFTIYPREEEGKTNG